MNWTELFGFVTAALTAIGSAGLVLFALSSWLGKVWANRILEKERTDLAVLKETILGERTDKIANYKAVVDAVAKILADLDQWSSGDMTLEKGKEAFYSFNQQRLKVYGYLAMVAPQAVMDAQDQLVDHILLVVKGKRPYIWSEVRTLALAMLNAIRNDIAIDKAPISYNGRL